MVQVSRDAMVNKNLSNMNPQRRRKTRTTRSKRTNGNNTMQGVPPPSLRLETMLRGKPHQFRRTLTLADALTDVVEVRYGYKFNLAQLPDFADFVNLYDQYRIDAITFEMIPRSNMFAPGSTSSQIVTVIDYDDDILPLTVSVLLQYNNAIVHDSTRAIRRRFQPAIAEQVYAGGATAYTATPATWLDLAYPAISHYGIKVGLYPSSPQTTFRVMATFEMSMRNAR